MDNKNEILEFIIKLVNALKKDQNFLKVGKQTIFGVKYILGQTLRHYQIPESHYCVSEKALSEWKEKFSLNPYVLFSLDENGIVQYRYSETIHLTKETEFEQSNITSNNRKKIKGRKFVFHKVFHEEHIVPINMIINELKELDELTYTNVLNVLDKIYICKMLKQEDEKLNDKGYKRKRSSTNFQDIINNEYKDAGINVIWKRDIQ